MKIINILLAQLVFVFSIIFSKTVPNDQSLHDTWRSKDNSKYRVWFQNWSGYTRLFLTINEDTLSVEPNKYAAMNRKKPYLFPKKYEKVFKRQIIGNIEWNGDVSWEEGHINTFSYTVDRSNPKLKLPLTFEGLTVKENGILKLELTSDPGLKYNMELVPTYIK